VGDNSGATRFSYTASGTSPTFHTSIDDYCGTDASYAPHPPYLRSSR